jgi:hypothetical protein
MENDWILPSRQYAHLQMAMKHCTKAGVCPMSHIGGEALARFCDRQTDGQTDGRKVQKQYVSPWKRGDIISSPLISLESLMAISHHIARKHILPAS